jgi:hypothetical protein
MPVALALFLAQTQSVVASSRFGFRQGSFSAIMPRPASKKTYPSGAIFFRSTAGTHSYTIGSLQILKQKSVEDYKWSDATLEKYAPKLIAAIKAGKVTQMEWGGFHGMPCYRAHCELREHMGIILTLLKGQYAYYMVCTNEPGDEDWSEAQRFFDSFRTESNVTSDPKLAKEPSPTLFDDDTNA